MTLDARPVFLALLLATSVAPAAAQTVYRCDDGYRQAPCGAASARQVDDERSGAQRSQAAEVARRDAKLADQMERERLKQEAQPPSAYIPAAKSPPAPASKASAAPQPFKAQVPGSGGERKRAGKKPAKTG